MIDVIIPAYNAHDTIMKTLISINLQTIKDKLNVYIIDDCSDFDYSKEIDLFSDRFNIKQLKLSENSGPGIARQFGIDNSDGEYIIFLDSDDLFYDCFSLENIYNAITMNDFDVAIGVFAEEKNEMRFFYNNHQGCLHGKLYKRKFLEKYDIKFNNTRSSEDNSFNQLVLLANPRITYCSDYIYCYKENSNSITRKDPDYKFDSIKWYIDNMIWAITEGEKRIFNKILIARLIVSSLGYVYYSYCNNKDLDCVDKILYWSRELVDKYKEYEKCLYEHQKILILKEYNVSVLNNISFGEFIVLVNQNS